MHILGFDSTLYSTFLDPTSGDVYTSGPMITGTGFHASRPQTSIITTPNVVTWAKNHFGCNSLTGMPV